MPKLTYHIAPSGRGEFSLFRVNPISFQASKFVGWVAGGPAWEAQELPTETYGILEGIAVSLIQTHAPKPTEGTSHA